MSDFFTCAPRAMETGRGAGSPGTRGKAGPTIDIHCHVLTESAAALASPHFKVDFEPAVKYASPGSRDINRAMQTVIAPQLTSAEIRLADMDRLRIDVQAISPAPLQFYYWAEPELGRVTSRLINDNLASIAAAHPDRFVALATVPLQAPELAVTELRRCVSDLGMRGVEISTNVSGRELSDPAFRPFFAAAEELDVLIFMHPMGFTQGDRLHDHYFTNTIGNPLDSTIAVSHLIFGGVLGRHPGLKICVAHGGGYLPTYMGRMDHAFEARADCRHHIHHPPSHYLRRLYFDTVVFDREHLAYLVARYGADHILLGSDYPYDMAETDPVGFVSECASLTAEDRTLILGGNAARLMRMERWMS